MPRPGMWPVTRILVREAWGVANLAVRYPLGLRAEAIPVPAPRETFGLPVVLVHGFFHNRSGFFRMSRALQDRGFTWAHCLNYHPVGHTIPSLAAKLSERVDAILEVSGAPRVHIIGHSLGGLIARWYIQEMQGSHNVDHCVTIATPHGGTMAAYVGLGAAARQMRPGSDVLGQLTDGFPDCQTKFVNVYSDIDPLIVPAVSAKLPRRPTVENVLVRGIGHGSMLLDPKLIRSVVDHLATAEVEVPLAEVRTLHPSAGTDAAAEGL